MGYNRFIILKDFGQTMLIVRNWLKQTKDEQDPDRIRIAELEKELKETKKKIADQEVHDRDLKKVYSHFLPTQPEVILKIIKGH